MAYDFQPDTTPALYFTPKSHVYYLNQRLWVMWPAYAYRVIAPLPTANRSVNLFQKAILDFCRIQEIRSEVIGKYLHLEPDLVEYILAELRRKDLINKDYYPTSNGLQILSKEYDDAPAEILTGYVFQDPWNKQLWPRIVDKLHFAPTEYYGEDVYPTLTFGSAGKPRRYKPFVKRSDFNASPVTPTVQEILEASYRHQRDLKRMYHPAEAESAIDESGDGNLGIEITNPQIQKVSLIGESPESYYLVTFLYRPEKDARPGEWYACDPFGLGASANLRRFIDELAQRDDLLRERLQEWLQKSESFHKNDQEQLIQDERVRREVETLFSNIAALMPFYPQMLAMMRSELDVRELEKPPRDKLNDVLIKAGIALEAVLDHIRIQYPAPGSTKIYNTADRQYRHELLNDIAGQIGFTTPVPRGLANIEPKRVQKAEKNGGTLGERLTAALLASRSYSSHPFRRAASQMPEMLNHISTLMHVRGQSAHFSDFVPSKQELNEYVCRTMKIARLLSITETTQQGVNNAQKE